VPYRNPEDRRRFDRERRRRARAGEAASLKLAAPARLQVADDVEALLAEAVELARRDPKARGIEKARALGYLASLGLRLIESHDLQDRLDALERVLGQRRIG